MILIVEFIHPGLCQERQEGKGGNTPFQLPEKAQKSTYMERVEVTVKGLHWTVSQVSDL